MKSIAASAARIAAFALVALAGSAAQAQSMKTPATSAFTWTSVYVGVHGGYSSADIDWTSNYPFGNPATRPTAFDSGDAVGGAQVGYMIQRGNWVFGSELSLTSGYDRDIKRGVDLYGGVTAGTMTAKVDYLVMMATRIGYSWANSLAYAKIGTAGASIRTSSDDNFPAPDFLSSSKHFYTGWVFGVGFEQEIMPNLMLGIEYNYVTLDGSSTVGIRGDDGSSIGQYRSNVDLASHSVLARFSYKMDTPALATLLPF